MAAVALSPARPKSPAEPRPEINPASADESESAPLLAASPAVGGNQLCSRELELQEYPDKYLIRSLDGFGAFTVGRSNGVLSPVSGETSAVGKPLKVSTIYGVAGIIRLLAGTYVLVITSRKDAGSYHGFPVYHINSMSFLSCDQALEHSTPQERRDEAYFVSLLRIAETTPGLFFSYDRDLTVNLQTASKLTHERLEKPLWKQADPRYIWNRTLLEELLEAKLDAFALPLIQGSFQSMQFILKDMPVEIVLISRRCNRRLGTRMWRRGANLEGATANFVETEQLVRFNDCIASFVQVRGSIPLLWEQIVDLSYKPCLNVIEHEETFKIVESHFYDLAQRYGEVLALDLTDQHGDEGKLSQAYAAEMKKLSQFRYASFDFHQACRQGNFDNLQILYDQIKETIKLQGYFLVDLGGKIMLEQNGAIRSNCIDCLDRTNVTQSFMARKVLDVQLRQMGAFSPSQSISSFDDVYDRFKKLWVDNGDDISLGYAGSHALKGDLVRYGRQTVPGLIKDGISALSRYYVNNFQDGTRQDAVDLISGSYTISRASPSPFDLNAFESLFYLPVASAVIIGGITMTTLTLSQAGRNAQNFIASVLCAGVTAGVVALVRANGRQFCSRPRLRGLY